MYPILTLAPTAVSPNGIGGYNLRNDIQKWVDENLKHHPVVVESRREGEYRVVFGSIEEATHFRMRWGFG